MALAFGGCGGEIITYTDSDYGFSFDYDDSWTIQESPEDDLPAEASKSVGVFDPRGSHDVDNLTYDYVAVSVYELGSEPTPTAAELKTGFAEYAQRLADSDETFWVKDPPASADVNGLPGVSIAYMYTDGDQEIRCTEYRLVDMKGLVYGLYTQSAVANWDDNRVVFDTFLNSFTLADDR